MNAMISFAMLVTFLARTAGASPGPDVHLRISESGPVGTLGDGPLIRVELSVRGKSPWVVFSGLNYSPPGGLRYPVSMLSFEIRDTQGRLVPAAPDDASQAAASPGVFVDYASPGVWRFLIMGPNDIWGQVVSLGSGPWRHAIAAGGEYRVRARIETDAGRWLRRRIASGALARDDVQFDPEWVVDGVLASGEIVIHVPGPAAKQQ